MRSSKSRSRNKNNRNRNSLGNVVNRVFDSSGPEGKVRGTPQQIIDKYNQLARDAQLSNDRVNAENFQQHAEHYLRMLSEAQRDQEQKREQQERENRERQAQRDRERAQRDKDEGQSEDGGPDKAAQAPEGGKPRSRRDRSQDTQPDVLDLSGDDDGPGLVDTPESRATAQQAPEPDKGPAGGGDKQGSADSGDKPKKPRAPRKPSSRKKAEPAEGSENAGPQDGGDGSAPSDGGGTSQDAAE